MQVTCIITKRIQWMNPSWLHYPLIPKATCSLGDSDILLNPRLLVCVLKEKDVKYKFVQSENLIGWSRGKKAVGARMRFVQSCTQRKRYILKHGQELITFYANHICVVYVFLVQKLSRLKRYLLLPASRNRGITSRKHSARILTCGASRRRYVLYGK